MKTLEQKINYTFKDKKLLENALTHSSYAHETRHPEMCNERLEFLGDSVLSVVCGPTPCTASRCSACIRSPANS